MDIYKKWLIKLILTSVLLLSPILIGVMGYNYYIDPLWNFNHQNEYNDYQVGFDERQQKTNYITARPFDYDSLLLGTSRVTYMDQSQFQKNKVYNYSLSEMFIDEYSVYTDYAKKQKKGSFDKIYMELYFESFKIGSSPYKEPSEILDNTLNPLYRFTSLFSYNTFERSRDNKKYSTDNYYEGFRSYNRENIASTIYKNPNIKGNFGEFKERFEKSKSKEDYPYDENYKEKLQNLVNENPETDFIVFTDPMPASKLKTMLSDPLYWDLYERWIREMVDVFGVVYSFQTVNAYTTDEKYWFDSYHYYPNFGDKMIANLEGREQDDSFRIIITEENLEGFFVELKEMIQSDEPLSSH